MIMDSKSFRNRQELQVKRKMGRRVLGNPWGSGVQGMSRESFMEISSSKGFASPDPLYHHKGWERGFHPQIKRTAKKHRELRAT